MPTRNHTLLALAASFLLVSPALLAGPPQYVPYAADVVRPGNQRIASALWVTNRYSTPATLTHYFIPRGVAGTSVTKQKTVVPGGATIFFQPTAPPNQTGILGLEGTADLQYKAVVGLVEGAGSGAAPLGTDFDALPIISAADATVGGETVVVDGQYGLRQLFVVNPSATDATCSADVYDVAGNPLGSGLQTTVKRRGIQSFSAVTNLLTASDPRAVVDITCTQLFYSYGLTWETDLANVALVHAAPKPAPPPPVDAPGCEIAGSYCHEIDGIFHQPKKNKSTWVKRVKVFPPAGTYKTLLVEFDVVNTGWSKYPARLHNLVWIGLNGRNWDMPGYLNVFGPTKDKFMYRHGFNMDQAAKFKFFQPFAMQVDRRYHIRYDYDMKADRIEVRITDSTTKEVVVNHFHSPNINKVVLDAGDHFAFDFGFDGSNPWEPASRSASGRGWKYLNFKAEVGNR